jgi:hypothetical protein
MRRALGVLIGASVAVSLLAPAARAVQPHHEKYAVQWVNVFWHSRARLDSDTYLKVTWYVGAYDGGSDGLFSDLYRSVERCQKLDGRDRCRYDGDKSWYGQTTRPEDVSFAQDKRLTSGRLDASYRLFREGDDGQIFLGRFHIVTDVSGTGELTRGRNSYTVHQGCTTIKYSGKYAYRSATAVGTLTFADGSTRRLDQTEDAAFGSNESAEIEHTC